MIVWPRPLASSSGEGVEEHLPSGLVDVWAVVAAGWLGVGVPVDSERSGPGVEVEDGLVVCPEPGGAEDLQADGLGRRVCPGLPDCYEAGLADSVVEEFDGEDAGHVV